MGVNKLAILIAAMCALLLSSCVTTTTGGFVVEPSEEQALEDYLQLALAYYDADDLAGARRHINNALAIDSRNADALTVMALIYQREGDLDLAEDNFERAISLDRDNSRARNNFAALLFSQERIEEAYEQLERVTRDTEYEGRAIAFENLGRSAVRLERYDEAEEAFQRALQLNPNLYVSALELSIVSLEKQDYAAARRSFQQYMTIADFYNIPHTPRALLAGVQIERWFQNDELADAFFRIMETLYQDSPEYQALQRLSDAN